MTSRTPSPRAARSGQTLTEYLFVVGFVAMILILPALDYGGERVSALTYLLYKSGEFYKNMLYFVCVPFP